MDGARLSLLRTCEPLRHPEEVGSRPCLDLSDEGPKAVPLANL